jgi:hypothetical protein
MRSRRHALGLSNNPLPEAFNTDVVMYPVHDG